MGPRRRRYGKYPSTRLASELAEATAPYGVETGIDHFKPTTSAARRRWAPTQRKPGRPRRGKGVKVICVSVEQTLLQHSDRLARELGVSRSRLIERGLRVVLAASANR